MGQKIDVVEELLGLARDPEPFSKDDMAEIALVAATEIMKLRRYDSPLRRATSKRRRPEA
ncbi:hypothetical protein [Mesorhizobium sp. KR1-2]|uniref:hypothetical protein n=1 Tax=Mesorhizobium sp. KR1-2 TaxID=3156609 RepID=UPI0032B4BBD8